MLSGGAGGCGSKEGGWVERRGGAARGGDGADGVACWRAVGGSGGGDGSLGAKGSAARLAGTELGGWRVVVGSWASVAGAWMSGADTSGPGSGAGLAAAGGVLAGGAGGGRNDVTPVSTNAGAGSKLVFAGVRTGSAGRRGAATWLK